MHQLFTTTPAASARTVQRFHLARYFTLASLVVFVPVVLILLYFQVWQSNHFAKSTQDHNQFFMRTQDHFIKRHEGLARDDLLRMEEAANVNLTRLFANVLWRDTFVPLVSKAQSISVEHCRAIADTSTADGKTSQPPEKKACYAAIGSAIAALPEFRSIDKQVAALMHESTVFKIKVYDLRGITIYSSEHSQIGEDKSDNPGWQQARAGRPASKLSHRDSFNTFEGVVSNRDLIESYVPVMQHDSDVVAGVFEVYADITAFLDRIKSASAQTRRLGAENQEIMKSVARTNEELLETATKLALAVILGLIVLLYASLYLIVRHGQRVIDRERMRSERAESLLRQIALELRQFADNVPAMTVSLDADLRYVFANKRYAEFFGADPETIAGRHLREVVGEAAYGEIEPHFLRALQGQSVTYRRSRKLPNGETHHLEVKIIPRVGERERIEGCFVVTADITPHILEEERIQRVAHHDPLTGLPNRILFNDRLGQTLSLAKRDKRQFALLFLDLDKFKSVNDTYGHRAGDQVLVEAANRIRRQVRESDTVARIGGDEFTVIVAETARREDALKVATKIAAAFTDAFRLEDARAEADLGTSIGIALYPGDGTDADALVSAADTAMYDAKQAGGGIRFFSAGGQPAAPCTPPLARSNS